MKKTTISILLTVLISVFIATGIIYAASHNITATLGGSSGDFFDVDGTMIFDSIKVGAQDVGGVTFFNGTIVNETTTNDADNPVTFGDNVRIDGRLYRGATAGTSDSLPLIVNDNMEVKGTLDVDGALTVASLSGSGIVSADNIASDVVTSAKINDGTIASVDIAAGAVTQLIEDNITTDQTTTQSGANYTTARTITMTTSDSSLFCIFSGYGTVDTINNDITIGMSLDGEIINHTVRKETACDGNGFLNMTTNAIFDVAAGEHTISLLWNTSAGTIGTLHANTFDCIEFKK